MTRRERTEHNLSLLMRLAVSMVMPLWGLAILVLGITWLSPWWILCGLVVIGVGLLFFVGSPLIEPFIRDL